MASINVTINAVNKNKFIQFNSLMVESNLYSAADFCYFTCQDYKGESFVPAGGDEIIVYDGATKIFGGTIINVKKVISSKTLMYEVTCKDWRELLDRNLVNETYAGQTVNQIITDMAASYFPDFDITNVSCATTIENIVFARKYVSQCLDDLAELTGYSWYIDPDKKIYFFAEGDISSPFDLTDTNGKYVFNSLLIEKDYTQIKNRINVEGASVASIQVEDATSIAAYGVHEYVERNDEITTTAEATQIGNSILALYKNPLEKGMFLTYDAGLVPGQQINISSTIRSLNTDYLIDSVVFKMLTTDKFAYAVTFITKKEKSVFDVFRKTITQSLPVTPKGDSAFMFTGTFSIDNYHQVSWTAGTLTTSDGTIYNIASGSRQFTGTEVLYLQPTASLTVLQHSTTLTDGLGSDRLALAYIVENANVSKGAQVIPISFYGGIQIDASKNIVARTIIADQIAANTITANEIAATTITVTELNFTPLFSSDGTGSIIATINASAEGITIEADNLTIAATTTFTAGWNGAANVGDLAVKDSAGASDLDATVISGGKIITGLLTATNIQTGSLTAIEIRTSATANVGIKMSSAIGGLRVHGETIQIYYGSTSYGYMGATNGYFGFTSVSGRNMKFDVGAGSIFCALNSGSGIAPLVTGQGNCGLSSQYWANVYANNYNFSTSYMNYENSAIRTHTHFGPSAARSYNCGTSTLMWQNVYTDALQITKDGYTTKYIVLNTSNNFEMNTGLYVGGTLSKSAGSFKINHPLKPKTHWLQHSFVESPDMLNIYTGNSVILNGKCVVKMPDWFIPLNGNNKDDFTYQLTSIGQKNDLWVNREMTKKGVVEFAGKKDGKFSYMITAIRHDEYALKNPIIIETKKDNIK